MCGYLLLIVMGLHVSLTEAGRCGHAAWRPPGDSSRRAGRVIIEGLSAAPGCASCFVIVSGHRDRPETRLYLRLADSSFPSGLPGSGRKVQGPVRHKGRLRRPSLVTTVVLLSEALVGAGGGCRPGLRGGRAARGPRSVGRSWGASQVLSATWDPAFPPAPRLLLSW